MFLFNLDLRVPPTTRPVVDLIGGAIERSNFSNISAVSEVEPNLDLSLAIALGLSYVTIQQKHLFKINLLKMRSLPPGRDAL